MKMLEIDEIIALLRLDGMSHTYARASSKTGYVRATIFDFDSLAQERRTSNAQVYKVSAFGQNKEEALRNAFEEHNIMFPKWKEKHARR